MCRGDGVQKASHAVLFSHSLIVGYLHAQAEAIIMRTSNVLSVTLLSLVLTAFAHPAGPSPVAIEVRQATTSTSSAPATSSTSAGKFGSLLSLRQTPPPRGLLSSCNRQLTAAHEQPAKPSVKPRPRTIPTTAPPHLRVVPVTGRQLPPRQPQQEEPRGPRAPLLAMARPLAAA